MRFPCWAVVGKTDKKVTLYSVVGTRAIARKLAKKGKGFMAKKCFVFVFSGKKVIKKVK